ncbi:aldehyde ferredoxin oxidoreductase family protein [Thermoflexus hugenholtzii]
MTRFGRLLRVDLSAQRIREEEIPSGWVEDFIGGSALAARMLWERLHPGVDPLGPENPLLFLTGPLTGTAGPAVGRFAVCARSPATGLWGESNCGGFWGPELRFAGYDALWIEGRAPEPVYLWIRDGRVEIRPAAHLWGRDPYAVQAAIRQEVGDPLARVAAIGVAGENRVPFALILCDHGRVAGRTGMGAVMGSKNLKAIAVRGNQPLPLARPEEFGALRSQANRALREDNLTRVFRETGTAGAAEYFELLGSMPKRYYGQGAWEGASKVSGAAMAETILSGVSACHACVIACGRVVTIPEGPYARTKAKGPEYETIAAFGSNLLNDDLALITHLGDLCDRYGLDSISMGNVLGLAYLLFERGVLTERDTGGLALRWGDARPAELLIAQTARREGFGALLAQGARGLARAFGAEDLAVEVKGLEVPYHDPRGVAGMALSYATSPRGACHNQSDFFMVELGQSDEELGIPYLDRHQCEGKARYVAIHQNWRTVCNGLVLCYFAHVAPSMALALLNAAMGWDWDLGRMLEVGERAWQLKRALNHRLGATRADDRLPKRLLEPLGEGGAAGFVPDLEAMLREYYEVRGWDPETGRPRPETLRRLGLAFAADDLERSP